MSVEMDYREFMGLLRVIQKKDGEWKEAAEEALKEATHIIADNLHKAASPYANGGRKGYATGRMYRTIIDDDEPVWKGDMASIKAGFRVRDALESIFIMNGSTPRYGADKKVDNAVYSTRTKQMILEAQKEILQKYMSLEE